MDRVSNYFFLPQKPPGLSAQNPSINETQRASIIDDLDSTSESEMGENAAPPTVSLLERFIGSQFIKDVASVAGYAGCALLAPGLALAAPGIALLQTRFLLGPLTTFAVIFIAPATPFLLVGGGLLLLSATLYHTSLSISHPDRYPDGAPVSAEDILKDMVAFNRNLDEPIVKQPHQSHALPSS